MKKRPGAIDITPKYNIIRITFTLMKYKQFKFIPFKHQMRLLFCLFFKFLNVITFKLMHINKNRISIMWKVDSSLGRCRIKIIKFIPYKIMYVACHVCSYDPSLYWTYMGICHKFLKVRRKSKSLSNHKNHQLQHFVLVYKCPTPKPRFL